MIDSVVLRQVTQIVCLFFAMWMTPVIYVRATRDMEVEGLSFALFTLGWTGFITFRWIL